MSKKHLPAGPFHICRALLRAVQGQGYLGSLDSPNGNNILGECLGGVRGFYSKHFDDGRDHPLLRRAPRSSPYFDESGCCVYGPSTDCQRRDGCDGVPNVRQMYSPKLQQVGLAMGIAGQIGALVCLATSIPTPSFASGFLPPPELRFPKRSATEFQSIALRRRRSRGPPRLTAKFASLDQARTGCESLLELLRTQRCLAASREQVDLSSISVKAETRVARAAHHTACRGFWKMRRHQLRGRVDTAGNQPA